MGKIEGCANPSDREFFGLELDATGAEGTFRVLDHMSNPRGTFYGGAGVAVAAAAMEAATERRLLWTTAQYTETASRGDDLQCRIDVLAHGRRTSQIRATITRGDAIVLTALGATGEQRDEVVATFDRMPSVHPPEASPEVEFDLEGDISRSRFAVTEHRVAAAPSRPRRHRYPRGLVVPGRRADHLGPDARLRVGPAHLRRRSGARTCGRSCHQPRQHVAGRSGGGDGLDAARRQGPVDVRWVRSRTRQHLDVRRDPAGHREPELDHAQRICRTCGSVDEQLNRMCFGPAPERSGPSPRSPAQ